MNYWQLSKDDRQQLAFDAPDGSKWRKRWGGEKITIARRERENRRLIRFLEDESREMGTSWMQVFADEYEPDQDMSSPNVMGGVVIAVAPDDTIRLVAQVRSLMSSLATDEERTALRDAVMDGHCELCGRRIESGRKCYCAPGYDE